MQTKFTHNKKDEHQKPKSDPQKSNEQNLPKQEVIPPGAKLVKISDFRTVHRRAEDIKLKPKDAEFYFGLIEDILQVTSPKDETIEWVHILGYGAILESVLKTTLGNRYISMNIPRSIDEYFIDYSDKNDYDPSKRFYNDKKHSKSIIQFVDDLKSVNEAWDASKHSLKLEIPAVKCLRYVLEFIRYASGKRIPEQFHWIYEEKQAKDYLKDFSQKPRKANKDDEPKRIILPLVVGIDSTSQIKGELLRKIKDYVRQTFALFQNDGNFLCQWLIMSNEQMTTGRIGDVFTGSFRDSHQVVEIKSRQRTAREVMGICLSMLQGMLRTQQDYNVIFPLNYRGIFITDCSQADFEALHPAFKTEIRQLKMDKERALFSFYGYDHNISEAENFISLVDILLDARSRMLKDFFEYVGEQREDIPRGLVQADEQELPTHKIYSTACNISGIETEDESE